jgi:hypothetical protein
MAMFRWRNLLFVLSFPMLALHLLAQDAWHQEAMLGANQAPLRRLRGIAVPAEAEYRGQKIRAYVFFSGHDGHAGGPGYPFFGVHVEDIEKHIPEPEIRVFTGPDLSKYATHDDAIRLSFRRSGKEVETSTRLLFTDGKYFETGFQTVGFFETNPRKSKSATDAWTQFLAQMSGGFEEGKVVIGGRVFSSELTVRFSGNGLGAKLRELMAYCNKQ